MTYKPVSCSFFEHLESLAVKKEKVRILYFNKKNEEILVEGIIVNIYSKDKAEFLNIDQYNIRLDSIIALYVL
jgi:hypothetical protein